MRPITGLLIACSLIWTYKAIRGRKGYYKVNSKRTSKQFLYGPYMADYGTLGALVGGVLWYLIYWLGL